MPQDSLRILGIGAHPDDCDVHFGATAIKYVRQGHEVKFISLTNGDTGHHEMGGGSLARRRYAEAQRAAAIAGITYEILDIHNGQLMPTLENRWWVVKLIREFRPDLVITHRPNDYHPDHRYTSQLVQDAAFTVTVPNVQALTPNLRRNPVVCYMSDTFQKPYPFCGDVVVDVDDAQEDKMRMLACHESQVYEWLIYNWVLDEPAPESPEERWEWLKEKWDPRFLDTANRYRERLKELYGEDRAAQIQYAEAFEICEYGASLSRDDIPTLFPFFAED